MTKSDQEKAYHLEICHRYKQGLECPKYKVKK